MGGEDCDVIGMAENLFEDDAAVVAVAAPADVEPLGAEVVVTDVFEDELVEVAEVHDDTRQLEVAFAAFFGIDVGGLTHHVLAMEGSAYQTVEFGAAVAAADEHTAPIALTCGVEYVVDQSHHVGFLFQVGAVP